jgi:hypothetical protein
LQRALPDEATSPEQFEQQEWSRRMSDIALFGVVPLVVLFALGYVLLW